MYNTDYSSFALMLSRRQSGSQSIVRVSLLCESWPAATAEAGDGAGGGAPQLLRAVLCSLGPRQNVGDTEPRAGEVCHPGPSSGPLGSQHRLPRLDRLQALRPGQEPGPCVGSCPRASEALWEPRR